MVAKKLAIWVSMLGAGFLILCAAYYWLHRDRIAFQRTIVVGMSREEVEKLVGRPEKILRPGDMLEKWGGSLSQVVSAETWVYFVYPRSQHRFVLTLSDGKVTQIDYAQN
jgi:hypothetical protein